MYGKEGETPSFIVFALSYAGQGLLSESLLALEIDQKRYWILSQQYLTTLERPQMAFQIDGKLAQLLLPPFPLHTALEISLTNATRPGSSINESPVAIVPFAT